MMSLTVEKLRGQSRLASEHDANEFIDVPADVLIGRGASGRHLHSCPPRASLGGELVEGSGEEYGLSRTMEEEPMSQMTDMHRPVNVTFRMARIFRKLSAKDLSAWQGFLNFSFFCFHSHHPTSSLKKKRPAPVISSATYCFGMQPPHVVAAGTSSRCVCESCARVRHKKKKKTVPMSGKRMHSRHPSFASGGQESGTIHFGLKRSAHTSIRVHPVASVDDRRGEHQYGRLWPSQTQLDPKERGAAEASRRHQYRSACQCQGHVAKACEHVHVWERRGRPSLTEDGAPTHEPAISSTFPLHPPCLLTTTTTTTTMPRFTTWRSGIPSRPILREQTHKLHSHAPQRSECRRLLSSRRGLKAGDFTLGAPASEGEEKRRDCLQDCQQRIEKTLVRNYPELTKSLAASLNGTTPTPTPASTPSGDYAVKVSAETVTLESETPETPTDVQDVLF
ncbi:hypothetical protein HPB51_012398 [Rhipicephalus microplus]|uniref:Uncharacterized protein n=1 Tax=Rhipicephalus microplus TaxID=6941 RepID=A0A9J6E9C0_RHIMP|nr:hypothetical protein HPB51_012398 [Rhipicephalus microplus]